MARCADCKFHQNEDPMLICPDACSHCSHWEESNESKLARFAQIEDRLAHCEELLTAIGEFAHHRSQGPAVADDLWEVRRMAYEL